MERNSSRVPGTEPAEASPGTTAADCDPGAGGEAPRIRELSRVFERHNRQLVAFLAKRLGNEAEAREVAQEAYARVLELDRPGVISFLRAYLYKTASRLAIDRIRRRARSERLEGSFGGGELTDMVSPDRQVLARESLGILREALLELPSAYRRAFVLSRFENRSTEQIGRALGLKSTQARLYLRRAGTYCSLRLDGLTRAEAEERIFS